MVKTNATPETIIFIVGNKKDLEKEDKRKVETREGEEFKNINNFQFFIEASAKENEFVNELFQQAMIKIYEQYKAKQENEGKERIDFSRNIQAINKNNEENPKKPCCQK